MGRAALRWVVLLSMTTAALVATAQLVPDAPVSGFRLPMFGDDGNPVWELRGKEGRYISEDQVDLKGMRLRIFAEDPSDRVETEIISPQAIMLVQKNQIVGDETITVVGDNFIVSGERWLWDGDEDTVVIDENVRVKFYEELTGILQ